jgi:hypothetical protein
MDKQMSDKRWRNHITHRCRCNAPRLWRKENHIQKPASTKHQNVTSVQTHQYPESRAPICLAQKAWWVQLRWWARTNTPAPVSHTKYVIIQNISSLLCLVPPHLRLTPRKDHARELVNLVKESGRKQEAAAKWTNKVSLFTGFAAWTCREKKHIIMIKGEDEHQKY